MTRPVVVSVSLSLALVGGCFTDVGPSGSGGETSTGAGSMGATGEATTEGPTSATSTTSATSATSATSTTSTTDATSTTTDATSATSTTDLTSASSTTGTSSTSAGGSSTGDPVIPGCDPAYYVSDFSVDPTPDWKVFGQKWGWNGIQGLYRGELKDLVTGTRLLNGAWTDVRVHARVRLENGSRGGVLLRATNDIAGEYFYVEISEGENAVKGFISGSDGAQFTVGTAVSAGAWMALDVVFAGDTLGVALDGQDLGNAFQFGGLGPGSVGLIVTSGVMEVDEFYVCPAGK